MKECTECDCIMDDRLSREENDGIKILNVLSLFSGIGNKGVNNKNEKK